MASESLFTTWLHNMKNAFSYWLFGINRKNYARKQIFVKKYFYLQISDSDRGFSLV